MHKNEYDARLHIIHVYVLVFTDLKVMNAAHNSLEAGVQQQSVGWKHAIAAADVHIKASLLVSKQRTSHISEPCHAHINECRSFICVNAFMYKNW